MVKISAFIDAIQIAVGQGAIKADAAAQAIQAFVEVGEFFLRRNPFDHVATAEDYLFEFDKRIQEASYATDAISLGLLRGIAESAVVSDSKSLGLGKAASDGVATSDTRTRAFGKGINDAPATSETMTRVSSKVRTDAAAAIDAKSLAFGRSITDSASVSDSDALHFGKRPVDSVATADSELFAFGKQINDTAVATDDLNGSAVADDDQTIQFIKGLTDPVTAQDILQRIAAYSRAFEESLSASDLASIESAKPRSDSVATADTGLVFWQNYADATYFAGDYVGNSQSF